MKSNGFHKILFLVLLAFIFIPVFVSLIFKPGRLPTYDDIENVFSYAAEDLLEEYDSLFSLASDFLQLYEESGYGELMFDDDSDIPTITNPSYLEEQQLNASLRPYNPVTNPYGYKNELERLGNSFSYVINLITSGKLSVIPQVLYYLPEYILFTFKFVLQFLYTVVSTFFTIFSIPYRLSNL